MYIINIYLSSGLEIPLLGIYLGIYLDKNICSHKSLQINICIDSVCDGFKVELSIKGCMMADKSCSKVAHCTSPFILNSAKMRHK
jgi:hypothetical protein